ncbi:MAG: hypothetical protein WAV23_03100 [Minisyncoccia bacterium]
MAKKCKLQKLSLRSFCTGKGGSLAKSMSNDSNHLKSLHLDINSIQDLDFANEGHNFDRGDSGNMQCLVHDYLINIGYFDGFPNGLPKPEDLHPLPPIIFDLPFVEEVDPVLKPLNPNNPTNPDPVDPDPISGDICDSNYCESDFYVCPSESDECYTDPPDPDSYVICESDWCPPEPYSP